MYLLRNEMLWSRICPFVAGVAANALLRSSRHVNSNAIEARSLTEH